MSEAALTSLFSGTTYNDPFFYHIVDNFLPTDEYQKLLKSFPKDEDFPEKIEGNKRRLSSRTSAAAFQKFCSAHPEWNNLFTQLSSAAFVMSLQDLTKQEVRDARGMLHTRPWNYQGNLKENSYLHKLWSKEVVITFEFSRLGAGAFVPAHTDAREKLVSLMYYFPDEDYQQSYGGSTVFYKPKVESLNNNWYNRRINAKFLDPVAAIDFVPNRLGMFVKSSNSYHAVTPITCPEGMARNSLNINIYQPRNKNLLWALKYKDHIGRWWEKLPHPRK